MNLRKNFLVTGFVLSALISDLFNPGITYSQTDKSEPASIEKQQGLHVICNVSYIISVPGDTRWIRLVALTPESVPDIQKINSVEYSLKPLRYFRFNGYQYAEFMIYNPERVEKLEVKVNAELYRYDLQTAMQDKKKNQLQETGLGEFLKEEKYIEKDDPKIRSIAEDITGASEVEIVKNIYNYVLDNMEYLVQGKRDLGAVNALRYKKGDCSEYSDLFAAICRAKNIPARVVTGFSVQPDTKTAKHNWVEVYFTKYGWVPFDPSKGDIGIAALKDSRFNVLEPRYVYYSHLRNDDVLHGYHYCSFTYFGDPVSVTDSVRFEFPRSSK